MLLLVHLILKVCTAQDGYQQQYFMLKSFEEGAQQLRDFCAQITPPDIMARFMAPARAQMVTPGLQFTGEGYVR